MEFVVVYNAETQSAAIIKPTYEERINLMLADEVPTLNDLHDFYLQQQNTLRHHVRVAEREDADFSELIDYCRDVGLECNYDRTKHPRIASSLYKKLRQLIHVYYCLRSGKDSCLRIFPEDYLFSSHVFSFRDMKRKRLVYLLYGHRSMFNVVHCVPETTIETVHGPGDETQDQASNVILASQREDPVIAVAAPSIRWSQYSSNDVVDSYSTVTDRWFNIGTTEWTTNHKPDDVVFQIKDGKVKRAPILPYDAVWNADTEVCDMPNLIPFKVHCYWRGDMEVKVQVNSNKYQIGQLQVSFYHQADLVKGMLDKCNYWTLSQMKHAVVSASASNTVTLYIPYKHAYPFIPCRAVPEISSIRGIMNMGRLYIKVLNRLATVTNGPDKCTITVAIRFTNSEFSGTCCGAYFAKAEMDFVTMAGAMKLLDTVMPDRNRDLPPLNVPPTYVVPTASHSWAHGSGQAHPVHSLRLDSRGQTHHPPACDSDVSITISESSAVYALVDQLSWSTQDASGKQLAEYPATPFLCSLIEENGFKSKYAVPPCGVIASMFKQWRGSLEFKFEIVASQFHTGRIMIGYVPGYVESTIMKKKPMSMNRLRASPYIVFDLQEERCFTFEVPYVSYKPWWPRQLGTDFATTKQLAPSSVFMYVLNPLVIMDSIPEKVYINVYLRSGKSFECSVPVQPSFGLTWHDKFAFNKDEQLLAIKGYAPYYCGNWHELGDSKVLVMRWGTLSDQIAQFNTPHVEALGPDIKAIFYTYEDLQSAPRFKKDTGDYPVQYVVVAWHSSGYNIGIPCSSPQRARTLAYNIYALKLALNDQKCVDQMMHQTDTSSNTYSKGNPALLVQYVRTAETAEGFEFINTIPEGEEVDDTTKLDLTRTLARSNHGQYFFGENFNDLKNYMRRYQFAGQITIDENIDRDVSKCAFFFPALPQGLELDVGVDGDVNELSNRCREGYIPLISSAYRYYRGSLRYRLVLPREIDMLVWIQHRPDRVYTRRKVQLCTSVETSQSVYNHGYGSYIQFAKVNNVVEFEIPFYNDSCYNWLQNPVDNLDNGHKLAITLGEVAVGLQLSHDDLAKIKGKTISIYYALADDMTFTHWVGFPLLYMLEKIPERKPRNVDAVKSAARVVRAIPETVYCVPEGLGDFCANKIKNLARETVDEIKEETTEDIKKNVGDMVSDVVETIKKKHLVADPVSLSMVVSQLGHIALHPTKSTVAWSLASVLIAMGLFAFSSVKLVYDAILAFGKKWLPSEQPNTTQSNNACSDVVKCQAQAPTLSEYDEETTQWLGILWMGVTSVLGVATRKPTNTQEWHKLATQDLGNGLRSSNAFMTFIRNTFGVLKKMFNYILGRTDATYALCQNLESHPEVFKAWAREVCFLTDPLSKRKYVGNSTYSARVYEATSFGQLLISDIAGELRTEKNTAIAMKLYDKIALLREELIVIGNNPYVRKLPFTIYVYGQPGIGKSHLSTAICAKLLASMKIPIGTAGMKCTINPQSDFWDQCEHQPVLEIDDIFAVSTPLALEKQLCTLFQVCSPVVLSPPKASLEDKKMRYNPEIFYLNSNKSFPKYNNVNDEALWRRRDVLIEAKLNDKPGLRKGCPHCDPDAIKLRKGGTLNLEDIDPRYLDDYHHLEFRFHSNPRDINAEWGDWLSFKDFEKILVKKFKQNREREHYNFTNRVRLCESISTGFSVLDGTDITEAYERVKQARLESYQKMAESTLANDARKLWDAMRLKGKDSVTESFTKLIRDPLYMFRHVPKSSFQLDVVQQAEKDLVNAPSTSALPETIEDDNYKFNIPDDNDLSMVPFSLAESIMCSAEAGEVHHPTYKQEGVNLLLNGEFISELSGNKIREVAHNITDNGMCFTDWVKTHLALLEYNKKHKLKRCKDMYDIIQLVLSAKDNPTYCAHEGVNLSKLDFLDKKLRTIENDYDWQQDCAGRCIFDSPFLKYLWYHAWLKINPTIALKVRCKKKDYVPTYFISNDHMSLFDVNGWFDGLLLRMRIFWEDHAKPLFKTLYNWLTRYIPEILIAITSMAALFIPGMMMYNVVKRPHVLVTPDPELQGKIKPIVDAHYHGKPDVIAPVSNRVQWTEAENLRYDYQTPIKNPPKHIPVAFAKPQSNLPQIEVVTKLIHRNTFFLHCYIDDRHIVAMRGVVMANREALVLRHYIEQIKGLQERYKEHLKITFTWHQQQYERMNCKELEIDFLNCRIIYYGSTDLSGCAMSNLCIVELPARIPESKSLKKFVCAEASHCRAGTTGRLIEPGTHNILQLKIDYNSKMPYVIEPYGDTKQVNMLNVYTYDYHAQGACGSILLADNLEQPIVGIHVAGTVGKGCGRGVAEPLSAEMMGCMPKQRLAWHHDITQMPAESYNEGEFDLDTVVYPHGKVLPVLAQAQSHQTRIVPSLIHGVFPVRTAPNPLSPSDPRLPKGSHPLHDGCRKHGLLTKDFPTNIVEEAYIHLRDKLLTNVIPITQMVGKQSMQIAVCGDPNVSEFDALNFKSSPGFPLNTEYAKKQFGAEKVSGKKWLFDLTECEEGYKLNGLHAELSRLINQTHQMRKRGIKPFTIFNDCLKDTTMPIEKNSIPGKTRIFSISPIQYTIPFKQYFGDFMGAYRRANISAEHGIGIDCNGHDWTRLAMFLSKFGGDIVTGDYKNFGPGLNLEVVKVALQIILDWYEKYENDYGKGSNTETKEERSLIRTIILSELIGAIHMYGNNIYRVGAGIPSGSPITDILNSIVNCLYIRIIFKIVTGLDISQFDYYVRLVTYGDDLIMNVNPEVLDKFNAITIGEAFKKFDITFTDQDKDGVMAKSRTIDTATFLKHGFARHPTRIMQLLAPLDKISIEGAANWISSLNDPIEATKQNAIQCCELAYGWGPAYYNEIRNKLVNSLQAKQIDVALPLWINLDKRIWDDIPIISTQNCDLDN
ncbi:polyprotein [Formica exsecta virus 2]|uniref:polyprotein n=1 Tax=Formica exsecta virus 2 TaxID=1432857 RepID=UPI0003D853B1|nr:polyprotein [Formica exsecta virus 2]AHB62422.1 polyprotein [Formica exsecta virus 2]